MESLAIKDTPTVSVEDQLNSKLRSSCDACGMAKVKCDRNQPQCGRCSGMRLSCVYGVSRKHGKPPRKKLRADAPSSNSRGSQNLTGGTVVGGRGGHQDNPIDVSTITSRLPAITPKVTSSGGHVPSGVSPMAGLGDDLFDPGFFMPLPLDNWPSYDHANVQQHPVYERQPQDFSVQTSPRSHDCAQEASEILQTLNSPVPFTNITAETVLTHFGNILRVNQDGSRRLTELLKCSCARKPHLVMLYASIISRIFLWYQHCACANAQRWRGWPKSKSQGSSEVSNATSVSEDSEPAVIACENAPLPALASSTLPDDPIVSIGDYTISDPCVHIVFRDQLIGIELKNLGTLVDLFVLSGTGDNAGSMTGLIDSLGTWLKTEHARTLKLLKEALQAFNESIIS